MAADADLQASVNPHYLDRVVAMAATQSIEASEDIVAGNGSKLLAKGARIDPASQERLLLHKLRKPLEQCVDVVGGVVPEQFGPIAEELLDRHALLATLGRHERAPALPVSLAMLRLSTPVRSLLTIYGGGERNRLAHAVGVAMIAMALARRLWPGDVEQHRMLALAGLVHDVGELYIEPSCFRRDSPLEPEQWRHIVSHPVLGHRVLVDMPGAGLAVSKAVLLHHERLTGHGYPRGLVGEDVSLAGQALGAAEWLMALLESGSTPLARASVSCKLVPGEYADELVETITGAAAATQEAEPDVPRPAPLEDAIPRMQRIARMLTRFKQSGTWLDQQVAHASGDGKKALEAASRRLLSIQTALSSTGLDASHPELLLRELATLRDPLVHLEVMTILRELEWRIRDLERRSWLREVQLGVEQVAVIHELVERLRGGPRPIAVGPCA